MPEIPEAAFIPVNVIKPGFVCKKKATIRVGTSEALRKNYLYCKTQGKDDVIEILKIRDESAVDPPCPCVNEKPQSYTKKFGELLLGKKIQPSIRERYTKQVFAVDELNVSKSSLGLEDKELQYDNYDRSRSISWQRRDLDPHKKRMFKYQLKLNKSYGEIYQQKKELDRSRRHRSQIHK